jgi:hypothetical protein
MLWKWVGTTQHTTAASIAATKLTTDTPVRRRVQVQGDGEGVGGVAQLMES